MYLVSKPFGLEFSRQDRIEAAVESRLTGRFDAVLRHLPAEDRRLAQLVLIEQRSHRVAGRLLRINPGVVTRRARRLRNLLASPTVRAVADQLDTLPEPARQVAIDHFLRRKSVALICLHRDAPRREVVGQLEFIRGWARALHRERLLAEARADQAADQSADPGEDERHGHALDLVTADLAHAFDA
jgi:hypothetical protein